MPCALWIGQASIWIDDEDHTPHQPG
jgi:hypothetical protein